MSQQKPESLTMYIPSNLNIERLLEENPPKFKFHRDHFVYLVHLVTYLPTTNDERDDMFVSLYSKLLQRTNHNYRLYLDYLIENGIFLENRQYIVGQQSRAFALTNEFQTEITTTKITYHCLIKNILNFKDVTKTHKEDADIFDIEQVDRLADLQYITKWFNGKLTVDYFEAKSYLEKLRLDEEEDLAKQNIFSVIEDSYPEAKKKKKNKKKKKKATPMQKYNRRLLVLKKIQALQFVPHVDQIAGRLHTVLTQTISGLRPFIKYDGKALVAVDVTNSQPYLALCLLKNKSFKEMNVKQDLMRLNPIFSNPTAANRNIKQDLETAIRRCETSANAQLYRRLVISGRFYEEFAKILKDDPSYPETSVDRKQAKNIVFSTIFSPNRAITYNQAVVLFKRHFPDVYKVFSLIKKGKHNSLACLLQSVEAKLVLHKACRIISDERPDLPIFTLHDSIVTTKGDEEYVHKILNIVLLEAIGEKPTLKYEPWSLVG